MVSSPKADPKDQSLGRDALKAGINAGCWRVVGVCVAPVLNGSQSRRTEADVRGDKGPHDWTAGVQPLIVAAGHLSFSPGCSLELFTPRAHSPALSLSLGWTFIWHVCHDESRCGDCLCLSSVHAAHLSGHPGYFGRPLPDVRGMCEIKGTLYSGEPCKDMQKREHAVLSSTDALVEYGKWDACGLRTLEREIGSRCSDLGENQGGWKCQIYPWASARRWPPVVLLCFQAPMDAERPRDLPTAQEQGWVLVGLMPCAVPRHISHATPITKTRAYEIQREASSSLISYLWKRILRFRKGTDLRFTCWWFPLWSSEWGHTLWVPNLGPPFQRT